MIFYPAPNILLNVSCMAILNASMVYYVNQIGLRVKSNPAFSALMSGCILFTQSLPTVA